MLWSALPDTDGPEVKWPPVLKVRQNGALADQLDWPDRALKPLQRPGPLGSDLRRCRGQRRADRGELPAAYLRARVAECALGDAAVL